jgi:hypothetical protein
VPEQDELAGSNKSHQIKATAVLKLTYLQMLGYDMSWAAFHIVEVMSSPGFAQKRIGYLGASVSYNDETEVVLLCTNMFKKDFGSSNGYEVGLAINCLANICTVRARQPPAAPRAPRPARQPPARQLTARLCPAGLHPPPVQSGHVSAIPPY